MDFTQIESHLYNIADVMRTEHENAKKIAAEKAQMEAKAARMVERKAKMLKKLAARNNKTETKTAKLLKESNKAKDANKKRWKDATGQQWEYNTAFGKFHDILVSTDEDVKIFGVHAASARRFMYGFLPPGMFRAVNKLGTVIGFLDISIRSVKKSMAGQKEEMNNMFTTMYKGYKKTFGWNKELSAQRKKGIKDRKDAIGLLEQEKATRDSLEQKRAKHEAKVKKLEGLGKSAKKTKRKLRRATKKVEKQDEAVALQQEAVNATKQ
jgi:hypothetical protein